MRQLEPQWVSLSEPQDAILPRLLLPLKSLLELRTLGISEFHSLATVLLNRGTSEAGACLVSVPAAGCFHLHFVLCYRSWRLLYLDGRRLNQPTAAPIAHAESILCTHVTDKMGNYPESEVES